MPEEAVMQIKMDSDLKEHAEALCQKMGTPSAMRAPKRKIVLGVASGRYVIPDNIDKHNGEIASMFGI